MFLLDVLTKVIATIANVILTPFKQFLTSIMQQLQDTIGFVQVTPNFAMCLGACIKQFVPYSAFIICFTLLLPTYTLNIIAGIRNTIKDWIPNLGQ